ncbi:MAG: DUF3604 domain-containing protein [Acidobacteriota bacterium]
MTSNAVSRALPTPLLLIGLLAFGACAPPESAEPESEPSSARPAANPLKNAYFGDLHIHTKHSFDAYLFSVRETPDAAYRFAKGETISHPSGYEIKLQTGALDFYAVTDHAMYMGLMPAMNDPESDVYDEPLAKELRELATGGTGAFQRAIQSMGTGELDAIDSLGARTSAWEDVIEAAERHNEPGVFTTFIGYEYTASTAERGNLHRNVIFRGSSVPELPFSRVDSPDPEDLWNWLDDARARGEEALSIPHNSNGSNGAMFELTRRDGSPMDAGYAEKRMRNEPLIELTQIKGTSEVHPLLSPNDEWADFEIFPFRIATELPSEPRGSYAREALLNGLVMEQDLGFNPFRFGFVAATDSHNAGGQPEEDDYQSKVGTADGTPQARGSVPLDGTTDQYASNLGFPKFGASGLAGVWAEENTRDSLYDAMRRKETFATSGPRLRVRFFAGYDFADGLAERSDMVQAAYADGVPMGADLMARDGVAPRFLLWATRDAESAPLQRLQIVKVWLDAGAGPSEQVFDVACADGLEPDPITHRCADNGAEVNLRDCSISLDKGAPELSALWSDPGFDASERALYYLRVLENPTCRWSTWDAIRSGVEPRPDLHATIQERAWSSPIWYVP